MFGIAGAVNASSSGGGGGEELALLADFKDAGANYSAGTWTASNDSSLKWEQATPADRPVASGKALDFDGANHYLLANAALRGVLDGLHSYSLVVVADMETVSNKPVNFLSNLYFGPGLLELYGNTHYGNTFLAKSFDRRNASGYSTAANGAAVARESGAEAFAMASARNQPLVTYYRGNRTVGSTTVQDVAMQTPGRLHLGCRFAEYDFFEGLIHCVRFYAGAISDSDWASIRSELSDNADYGLTGVTV